LILEKNGIYKYYSGVFNEPSGAAKRKIDLIALGFNDAFIVPYQSGVEVKIKDTPIEVVEGQDPDEKPDTDFEAGSQAKAFRVQIGVYSGEIPLNVVELFLQLGSVDERKTDDGLARFIVGSFKNYDDATTYKERLVKMGLTDAFVVGEMNGKLIPAEELKILINK